MAATATTVEQTVPAPAGRGRLLQVLGVAFGIAVIIGNTIQSGILRTPGSVAALLPGRWMFLLAWVAGGVYALLGVMSLAELGVIVPRSGGQYVFAQRAFGPYAGSIIGWSDWISTVASYAAAAILIGEYTTALLPDVTKNSLAIAVGVVVAFTALHYRGVKWGDAIQQTTTVLKALAYVGLIVACFALVPSSGVTPTPPGPNPATVVGVGAVVLAMQAVIFTYDGWNGMLYFSEELPDPGRQIPRAMFSGVFAIIAIYLLVNVAFVHVLGMDRLAKTDFAAGAAARDLFGAKGDTIIRVLLIVALVSGVNAFNLMAPRILYAMSLDGLFPRWGGTVNKGGTPTYTMLLSGALAIALLLTGTFNSVIAVAAFYFVLNYVFSFAAVFKLRRSMPDAPRPYRALGYPFTTGFSLFGGIAFLVGAIITDQRNSLVAIGMLVASYPVYALTRRAARRREQAGGASPRP
jgi:basic amino acid/polyamine antiporter, APA family